MVGHGSFGEAVLCTRKADDKVRAARRIVEPIWRHFNATTKTPASITLDSRTTGTARRIAQQLCTRFSDGNELLRLHFAPHPAKGVHHQESKHFHAPSGEAARGESGFRRSFWNGTSKQGCGTSSSSCRSVKATKVLQSVALDLEWSEESEREEQPLLHCTAALQTRHKITGHACPTTPPTHHRPVKKQPS